MLDGKYTLKQIIFQLNYWARVAIGRQYGPKSYTLGRGKLQSKIQIKNALTSSSAPQYTYQCRHTRVQPFRNWRPWTWTLQQLTF